MSIVGGNIGIFWGEMLWGNVELRGGDEWEYGVGGSGGGILGG
jgi:hypothetical protein